MIERVARLTAMTVAAVGILLLLGAALNSNVQPDADAYWLAAQRLRDGHALYGGPRGDETEIYRYAPWFAYAWVPLTYLGQDLAYSVWRSILVLSTLAAVWPLLRRPTPAAITLSVLLGGLLLTNLPAANVTPLIVGMLTAGLRTRVGPVILGLAGSLKLFPLVFVAGYVSERRWLAAAVAIAVASMLWLNILAFDILLYTQIGGPSFYVGGVSIFGVSPLMWVGVAGTLGLLLLSLVARRSPWAWMASAAAIPLAVPRVWLPDAAYLLTGVAELDHGRGSEELQGPETPGARRGRIAQASKRRYCSAWRGASRSPRDDRPQATATRPEALDEITAATRGHLLRRPGLPTRHYS